MEFSRTPTTLTTIVVLAAATVFLLSNSPYFNQPGYSQITTNNPGSQDLSSLLKSFLKPPKDVSGHYSNPQFGITDIVFPDGWHGRELPPIIGLMVIERAPTLA